MLDALSAGRFFASTGEVLLPRFTYGGKRSGETMVRRSDMSSVMLDANVELTFPLAFAEIITGDGEKVHRQRVELTDTESFGSRTLQV